MGARRERRIIGIGMRTRNRRDCQPKSLLCSASREASRALAMTTGLVPRSEDQCCSRARSVGAGQVIAGREGRPMEAVLEGKPSWKASCRQGPFDREQQAALRKRHSRTDVNDGEPGGPGVSGGSVPTGPADHVVAPARFVRPCDKLAQPPPSSCRANPAAPTAFGKHACARFRASTPGQGIGAAGDPAHKRFQSLMRRVTIEVRRSA
jgi:hypothetical protein